MHSSTRVGSEAAEPVNALTGRRLGVLVVTTVLAYFVLYAPQPLLPLFQRRFAVSPTDTALLMSAAMLPLSIAPLVYGSLLAWLSPLRLLRIALLVLAASEVGFVLADTLWLLVAIRFVQGLMLPAVFTALTTYIATTAHADHLRRTMALYVAATIVGGYLGRLLAGFTAALLDWRVFFVGLAGALLVCVGALAKIGHVSPSASGASDLRDWLVVLRAPAYLTIYVSIFCLFFVFAGLLNFLPFRMGELVSEPPEWLTGLMYTGYLLGVATSLGSGWITARLGGDRRTMLLGYSCYLVALGAALVPDIWLLFLALFVFCGSMFLVHALAAGLVNQIGTQQKGIVNGSYMMFYYGGGVLGSYLPGFVYERAGWGALVAVIGLVAAVGLLTVVLRPWLVAGGAGQDKAAS